MSISIQNNTSYAYSAVKARSVQSEVTLSGEDGSVVAALPAKQNGSQGKITGKLNSLEHAATTNARPMFLKGVLQKLTGVKARDFTVEQFELTRSDLSVDSAQADSLTSEQMHLEGQNMSLSVQGTLATKTGSTLNFDMQLSSSRISALYTAQTLQHQPVVPDQLDVAA